MSNRRTGPIVFLVVSVGFIAVGYFIGIHAGKPILDKATQTTSWPTVEGKIESAEVTQWQDHDANHSGPMYSANISYTYAVNGRTYKSSGLRSGGKYSSSSSSEQQGIVNRYPQGKAVPVSYDPDHPEEAVLEPGVFFTSYISYVAGLVVLVVGVLMFLSIPWTIMRRFSGAG